MLLIHTPIHYRSFIDMIVNSSPDLISWFLNKLNQNLVFHPILHMEDLHNFNGEQDSCTVIKITALELTT